MACAFPERTVVKIGGVAQEKEIALRLIEPAGRTRALTVSRSTGACATDG